MRQVNEEIGCHTNKTMNGKGFQQIFPRRPVAYSITCNRPAYKGKSNVPEIKMALGDVQQLQ